MSNQGEQQRELHGKERLAAKFVGSSVRIFLDNGAVLSGKMVSASEDDAWIIDHERNKEAVVTFDHVVSITRY